MNPLTDLPQDAPAGCVSLDHGKNCLPHADTAVLFSPRVPISRNKSRASDPADTLHAQPGTPEQHALASSGETTGRPKGNRKIAPREDETLLRSTGSNLAEAPGAGKRPEQDFFTKKLFPALSLAVSVFVGGPDLGNIQEMRLDELSDEELIARHRSAAGSVGDDRWVSELFRRHYARVVRWCLRFTGDREEAADLAQEIFVKAYRHLETFQGQAKFSTWLYSIARNECLNTVKARSIRPVETGEELLLDLPDGDNSNPYLAAERASSAQLVRALLEEALDETEKKVFTLHYGEDLPLEAITRLLGLENPSGAKAYIVSARRKLSRSVQRWKARGLRDSVRERER